MNAKRPLGTGVDGSPLRSNDLLCPLCGSHNITTHRDVGWDIDESGEERQHIDRCECGAWRFHMERLENFTTPVICFGKWHDKDDGLFSVA